MHYGTPGSEDVRKYYDRHTPSQRSPTKENYLYDDHEVSGTLNSALRNLHISSSISEDESQINNILKGLKAKLADIENSITQKENEKAGIMEDINVLTQRMKALTKSIAKKKTLYESYDKILRDSENALGKITESTKTLLQVVKKENGSLNKLTLSAKKY